MKPKVELLLIGHSNVDKIVRDMEAERRFAMNYSGEAIMISYRPMSNMRHKEKMFAFLFGPLMDCLYNGMTEAGFVGTRTDFYKAMKYRYASFPWINPLTKKEETDTLDFSSDKVTAAQLHDFINKVVLFIEQDLGIEAPDSSEFVIQKRLGASKKSFR